MQRGVVNGKPERLRLKVEQRFAKSYPGQNVVGYLPGRKSRDSVLLITAHYDHLGKMGDSAIFPGANDNASGIAMMMDLAEWFAQHPKQRPKRYDLAFIAFGGEEAGLVGSRHFVLNAPFALGRVAMVLNLDLMATGESGLMVVNGKNRPHYLQAIKKANRKTKGLSPIKSRPNAPNSDHFFFTRSGVPAFFWYLMGRYPYYHDVYDTPDKVGLAGYPGAFRLARQFVKMFPL
jgi:Zn-dependent M28 family amino/carboxypeptidase